MRFALALALMQVSIEGSLTDVLGTTCRWGDSPAARTMVLGYIQGYVEGIADGCGLVDARFCGGIAKLQPESILFDQPKLAGKIDRLCQQNPSWTLRNVAKRILIDEGVANTLASGKR